MYKVEPADAGRTREIATGYFRSHGIRFSLKRALSATRRESMILNAAEAERIASFLNACAATDQADLAFVFGTRLSAPAYIASELYRNGVVPLVVLTGGMNRVTGVNEAEQHLEILLSKGVPRDRIIIEDQSTNTAENVYLALPKMALSIELESIRSVIAVAKWFHSRRAIMTLKRYMPPGIRYFSYCYEPAGISRAGWYLNDDSANAVLKEWAAIPQYLEAQGITEIREVQGAFE